MFCGEDTSLGSDPLSLKFLEPEEEEPEADEGRSEKKKPHHKKRGAPKRERRRGEGARGPGAGDDDEAARSPRGLVIGGGGGVATVNVEDWASAAGSPTGAAATPDRPATKRGLSRGILKAVVAGKRQAAQARKRVAGLVDDAKVKKRVALSATEIIEERGDAAQGARRLLRLDESQVEFPTKERQPGRWLWSPPIIDPRTTLPWDVLMLLLIGYVMTVTPFELAFIRPPEIMDVVETWPSAKSALFTVNKIVDGVFVGALGNG